MKKIMILGAGIYQVPLIKTAKRMGLYTIVVSIPGNYPGFVLADKVYYENTVDDETILAIAREERIDGIVTSGTDVCVITIGKVCDAMGLCGLSYHAAQIAVDKMLMKSNYEEYGVRTARFRKVLFSDTDIRKTISGLNFPLIFKSVDSSGSRGITRVDSFDEFDASVAYVRENTRKDYFLIEEFIEGEEFGAQAFVYQGEVSFILPHGDYVFHGDTGVPIGHFAPYNLSEEVILDAKEQLRKAVKAMGLDNCAINADFILKDNKTYVLELGGRCGATCLAELVSIYYDFDYYEKILKTALGEDPDFDCTRAAVPNASHLLMSDRDGIIRSETDHNDANENIYEVQFDYAPGDEVHKFHVGPHRIGHVITKGSTLEEAQNLLFKAMEQIEIIVE
ncbi:MAG: ATP-grasp domain-containing protein [Clostridiales bacterium]|nr:ATP-grasp domain-containing protein [Clostridiales bacterium]